ncbi:fumarate hydratase [Myxococcus xanthus]|uniref:Fumarate hydratase class I n=2 Tax=Myxococcaceae TaxID=31 RepID=A0AAE6FZK5_MYXXA|nr:fumarate hydratase [Myxococcus xanthus]QDE75510.1 fumarate hydratase [Myxococcus xanthus]QDE82813.1 fumarate hydratase [Myxococcus xanthus]QDF04633.1 fumarate hydratase [Myxococcus xanthus]
MLGGFLAPRVPATHEGRISATPTGMTDFQFQDMLPLGKDETPYRLLSKDHVSTFEAGGRTFLQVAPEALTLLTREAMRDIAHLLRPGHLKQLSHILEDPEASSNDRFVALELLKNANIAAGGVLPSCQDTGTAIVMGKKGQYVITGGNDEEAISRGVFETYQTSNLRYSQMAPLDMYKEVNTGNNLPAQIELYATDGDAYKFLFMAKGGGSANKSYLFQETKALLNPQSLLNFVDAKIRSLGTAACPPYHLAIVIGGTSAEYALKTAKYASARYLDSLPTEGNKLGRGFRDVALEQEILKLTQRTGIGAQFGGKYFCHDVRVIRLPRHGASCPVAIAVSCSADRQILGKITQDGIFLEQLEADPAKYLPETTDGELGGEVVKIDLNRPMSEIRAELSRYPIKTRLSLSGPLVVARDIAHAKIKEVLDAGNGMPQYLKDYMVYYAGPAKTPEGYASGSFGPTTAGRMDAYVDQFQAAGGSFVMLAKGNRSTAVTEACKKHGGFYLGSIGGPAARLAKDCITKVEVLEYAELGMEAVWKIEVVDFPAFIVVDDKGNDFFANINKPSAAKKA